MLTCAQAARPSVTAPNPPAASHAFIKETLLAAGGWDAFRFCCPQGWKGNAVVFELPCPGARYLFVASNLHDRHKAEHEIMHWAQRHGYQPRPETQPFTTFRPSQARQEWRLLERASH